MHVVGLYQIWFLSMFQDIIDKFTKYISNEQNLLDNNQNAHTSLYVHVLEEWYMSIIETISVDVSAFI